MPPEAMQDAAFDEVIVDLVSVARRAGLRVGTAETLDAQAAAAAVGLTAKEDFRAALAATLCKRPEDRATFDRVFDGFFRSDPAPRPADQLRAQGVDQETLDAMLERLEAAGGDGSGGGLASLLSGDAEIEQRLERALREANVSGMQSPMQVGLYSLRVLEEMRFSAMEQEAERLRAMLAADGADPSGVAEALSHALEGLRRRVRARVREDFEAKNPDRLARSRAARLEREALANLDKDELRQVTEEVRRLGHVLRDRLERQRRRARRGRLDVRSTVRSSLRTGGVPFAPVFRRRRRDRPKLVVLCDVSDSVRAAARFLLVLVYAMQEAFSRTRSFVFVRDVGECTQLFDAHPVDEAVALAFGGDAVPVGANSDYGRVLGQFADRHLDLVDRRTTVVILGDGRSNHLDANAEALESIRRRAARVVWLNPEPRNSWGFGDSEMARYLPHCTFAASVRSLGELRHAIERLARAITR
ncbi:MAG: VWA domain-containing protein [Sandaracinaceae bacterium]